VMLGKDGDDLVSFISSGERGTRVGQRDVEKDAGKEKRLRGSPAHVVPW